MQTPSLIDIITHTPFWVWAALLVVLWLGLRRAQDREVTVSRLVIFPAIIVLLALSNFIHTGMGPATLEGFALGILGGAVLAVAMERRNAAVRLPDGRLFIKGEWTAVLVVLAIFVTRYATTVIGLLDPGTAASWAFLFVTALVSGFFSALMVVRTGLRLKVAFSQPVALTQG